MSHSESDGESAEARRSGQLSGFVIPIGSFLLFLVQPIAAKAWMPSFGGSAGLWLAAVMCFQLLLFLGYLYAHVLLTKLPARYQALIHLSFLTVSLLHRPRVLDPIDLDSVMQRPLSTLFSVLMTGIGIQYLVLSSTSTLVQGWMSGLGTRRVPYRLFALSNLFSIVGLVAYPFVLEPFSSLDAQLAVWLGLYTVYAVLFGLLTIFVFRANPVRELRDELRIAFGERGLWALFSAAGSVLLLGFTSRLCQDVAPVPLLWVLPLAAYLLSFVVSFERPRWYRREYWLGAALLLVTAMLTVGDLADIRISIFLNVSALFALCVICHSELYERRPKHEGLSSFYLSVSLGGALGSIAVVWGATLVLKQLTELYFGIVAVAVLLSVSPPPGRSRRGERARRVFAAVIGVLGLGSLILLDRSDDSIESRRNFYGVVSVHDGVDAVAGGYRFLRHGKVNHGIELRPSGAPASYFSPASAPARVLTNRSPARPLRVGVIGLGAGALAYYGAPGDSMVFYEINPDVADLAKVHFSFLERSKASMEIVIGDGRLMLVREEPRAFDVLMIDAFSGDAVPYHLITREALAVYRRHLRGHGVIVFQLSNSYLNLVPIVKRLADDAGMASTFVSTPPALGLSYEAAYGVLATESADLDALRLGEPPAVEFTVPPADKVWTDRYSSILSAIR